MKAVHEWRLVRCLRLGIDERTIAKHSLDDPTSIVFDCVLQQVLERKSRGNGGRRIPQPYKEYDTMPAKEPRR
jgi:hypothetical protein